MEEKKEETRDRPVVPAAGEASPGSDAPAVDPNERIVEDPGDGPHLTREEAIRGVMIRAINGKMYKVSARDYPNLPPELAILRVKQLFYTFTAMQVQGGDDAKPGKWPWAVAFLDNSKGKFVVCGGALVSSQWVLTAAHCPIDTTDVALVGETSLRKPASNPITVSSVCRHPDFVQPQMPADLALVKLETSPGKSLLPLTSGAPVLEQPPKDSFVVGWGEVVSGGGTSMVLQEVQIPLVSTDSCAKDYKSGTYYPDVTPNHVCAGEKNSGKGACNSDSGGPLMVSDGSGGWFDIGVFSFGNACSTQHDSGVYTKTSPFLPWISDVTTGNNPKCKG